MLTYTLTQACIGVSHSCILTTIFNIYSSGCTYLNILSIVKKKKKKISLLYDRLK